MIAKAGSECRRKCLEIFLPGLGCSCRGLLVSWKAKGPETEGTG